MSDTKIYRVTAKNGKPLFVWATSQNAVRDWLTRDTEIKPATKAEVTSIYRTGERIEVAADGHDDANGRIAAGPAPETQS